MNRDKRMLLTSVLGKRKPGSPLAAFQQPVLKGAAMICCGPAYLLNAENVKSGDARPCNKPIMSNIKCAGCQSPRHRNCGTVKDGMILCNKCFPILLAPSAPEAVASAEPSASAYEGPSVYQLGHAVQLDENGTAAHVFCFCMAEY